MVEVVPVWVVALRPTAAHLRMEAAVAVPVAVEVGAAVPTTVAAEVAAHRRVQVTTADDGNSSGLLSVASRQPLVATWFSNKKTSSDPGRRFHF
jgi:hypothetical protein